MLPATIQALELSGAAEKVRAAGFTVKRGATMAWGIDHELWTWYFHETNKVQPHAYQVNRDEFDDILLNHAISCGVKVHENTKVDRVRFDDEHAIGIEINGTFHSARFVVDASGQYSLIANQHQDKVWDDEFRNLAVYRYYESGTHLADDAAGNILVESIADGWLWKIPLKDGISSVGIVADRDHATEAIRASTLEQWFEQVVKSSDYTSALLEDATGIGPVTATRDWSYSAKRFTGPKHCLIGDAACFIDPLFSTGVHLAIYSATIGAAFVTTALEDPTFAPLAAESFERQYREHYSHFRELARLFYGSNRSIDSYFWQARQITGEDQYAPRDAFVRAVSGQTSHGYERTTLSHGELPSSFLNALDDIEAGRERRRSALDQEDSNGEFFVSADIELVDSALFTGEKYEAGTVIRRTGLSDLPVSPFVAAVVAQLRAESSDMTKLKQILITQGWPNDTVTAALKPTVDLLFLEGILERSAN